MKNVSFIFFLPLWVFLSSSSAYAVDFQAKVIHIADGDTITVLNNSNEKIKIRLNGIDCPEKAQAYGNKAKQFTKDLVHGERVTIKAYDTDRYEVSSIGVHAEPKQRLCRCRHGSFSMHLELRLV